MIEIVTILHLVAAMITGASVTGYVQSRVPAAWNEGNVRILSPRERLWWDCEHEGASAYVKAGPESDRPFDEFVHLCMLERGCGAEHARGKPEAESDEQVIAHLMGDWTAGPGRGILAVP